MRNNHRIRIPIFLLGAVFSISVAITAIPSRVEADPACICARERTIFGCRGATDRMCQGDVECGAACNGTVVEN